VGYYRGLNSYPNALLLPSITTSTSYRIGDTSISASFFILTIGDFGAPGVSALEFGAPGFNALEFNAPDFNAPDFSASGFGAPDFGAPDFRAFPNLSESVAI
jgi:hypothetical protein